jgi:hypothetical protein
VRESKLLIHEMFPQSEFFFEPWLASCRHILAGDLRAQIEIRNVTKRRYSAWWRCAFQWPEPRSPSLLEASLKLKRNGTHGLKLPVPDRPNIHSNASQGLKVTFADFNFRVF